MVSRDPPIAFESTGEWYDGEIRRFVRLDNENPPLKRGVVFVGSSIFREWREVRDFAADFAPLPVLNRAFGGSTAEDQLRPDILNAIVYPHDPRVLVYYCGSNDLNEGKSPSRIRDAFVRWSETCRRRARSVSGGGDDSQSGLQIVYVSVNKAPQKMPVWDALDETNDLIRAYCEATPNHAFVDVNPSFFEEARASDATDADETTDSTRKKKNQAVPKFRLFRDDLLHFRPDAYDAWIGPVIDAVFAAWERALSLEKRGNEPSTERAHERDPYLPPKSR
jgi:lysophospholipase L1-like esterase